VKTAFAGIKKTILISIPRTITVSSNEITELFLISFASFLLPGSISIFNFSFNLQSVPFSIIGVSYSMAVFPTLARHFGAGQHDKFVEEMVTSSRHIIFWSVAVSVMFIMLRAQIVRVILGAGQFNWNDTRLTAAALALFTVSLIAQNMTTLFVRSYYSRGKTRTPLTMNMISSVAMVLASYLLVHFFNHAHEFQYFIESILKVDGIPGTVVLMLPLGYSIGTLLNMTLHWWDFHHEFPSYSRRVFRTAFEITGASFIMGYVTYVCLNFFGMTAVNTTHTFGIFLQGFLSGLVGIAAGIVVLLLLKNEEIQEVWKTLHGKIFKPKQVVVGPDATMK
jgi:putative peptidoglycan lipid II flippase